MTFHEHLANTACCAQRNGPRGIPKGGVTITVNGEGFGVINSPKIYVVYDDKEFNSVSVYSSDCCSIVSRLLM